LSVAFIFGISAGSVGAVDVIWDGGGADNKWTTALNWSDDTVPGPGSNYFVNADTIQSPGNADNVTPRTYVFEGDSLSVANGSKLYLRKKNTSGIDYVTLEIPNLLIENSTVETYSDTRNLYQTLSESVEFRGACTIYLSAGTYGNFLQFEDGITGSGSIYVRRTITGYAREVVLMNGDFSGYSGDWTLENTSNTEGMVLRIQTSSGWGSGNLDLKRGGYLALERSVNQSQSRVTAGTQATIYLADGTDSTFFSLTVDSDNDIGAGTYTVPDLNDLAASTTFAGGSNETGRITIISPAAGFRMIVR